VQYYRPVGAVARGTEAAGHDQGGLQGGVNYWVDTSSWVFAGTRECPFASFACVPEVLVYNAEL
jgi:hypothetical protein